jgi:serine protease
MLVRVDRALSGEETRSLYEFFRAAGVSDVQPNYRKRPADFNPTNDQYRYQCNLQRAQVTATRTNRAWDFNDGEGVRVAVLDTGITRHRAFEGQVLQGYDFVSNAGVARDGDGRDRNPADEGTDGILDDQECASDWHGTKVAGVVAAAANRGGGSVGVAFRSKIIPIRVLAGRCGAEGTLADSVDAIRWAAGGHVDGVPDNTMPAQIINASMGSNTPCSVYEQDAINFAYSRGVVVVAAVGNDNMDARNQSPANCNHVISVGAVDQDGNRWRSSETYASNYGVAPYVDIVAPGVAIKAPTNASQHEPDAGLDAIAANFGATSAAAPHVAGAAALLLERRPTLTPDGVQLILTSTARRLAGCLTQCGAGALDTDAAVRQLTGPQTQSYGFLEQQADYPMVGLASTTSVIPVTSRVNRARTNPSVRIDLRYSTSTVNLRFVVTARLFDGSIRSYALTRVGTALTPYVPTDYRFASVPNPADVYMASSWTLTILNYGEPAPPDSQLNGWNMWL